MMPPKCYTWLESCGSQLSDGKNEKLFFCILQSVGFSRTLRTDIFLYTEKLSYVVSKINYQGLQCREEGQWDLEQDQGPEVLGSIMQERRIGFTEAFGSGSRIRDNVSNFEDLH